LALPDYAYAIRDSVVSAESVAWFARVFYAQLGVPLKTRIAGYTAAYFTKVFENDVYNPARVMASGYDWDKNVKLFLGWDPPAKSVAERERQSEVERNLEKNRIRVWYPSVQMQKFARFYAGGWNVSIFICPVFTQLYSCVEMRNWYLLAVVL